GKGGEPLASLLSSLDSSIVRVESTSTVTVQSGVLQFALPGIRASTNLRAPAASPSTWTGDCVVPLGVVALTAISKDGVTSAPPTLATTNRTSVEQIRVVVPVKHEN